MGKFYMEIAINCLCEQYLTVDFLCCFDYNYIVNEFIWQYRGVAFDG